MKYQIMIRSIPVETISEVHHRLIVAMNDTPKPWGFGGSGGPPVPDCGWEQLTESKLFNYLGPGFRGSHIIYRHRGCKGDHPMYDDFMVLEFNPIKQQYGEMLKVVLPHYISAFHAYLAFVQDVEWILVDREEKLKHAPNSRYSVYRICPVHYFGELLCLRAFRKSPTEMIRMLSRECEHVEPLCGGVFLVATSKVVGLDEANQINKKLWNILKAK